MRILYTVTMGIMMRHFKEFIGDLVKNGHTVDIACNEDEYKVDDFYRELGCEIIRLSCIRKPFSADNIKCYKEIKQLVEERKYDIVHCHTPVAAFLTRLACRKARKQGTKVIYTAHGFHFFKGAPLKNWLIYYPAEKFTAHFTDLLITINQEDYEIASRKMKAKEVKYVPGVGLNLNKFKPIEIDRAGFRKSMGVPEDAILIVSVGELNTNKNHAVVVKAIAELNNPKIHYCIAGLGNQKQPLEELASSFGMAERLHLLGYREDINDIYNCADICCFPSLREGLGMAALEGMAAKLPVVVSDNRGIREFVEENVNGFICDPYDHIGFSKKIKLLIDDVDLCREIGEKNALKVQEYSVDNVVEIMKEIYFGFQKK